MENNRKTMTSEYRILAILGFGLAFLLGGGTAVAQDNDGDGILDTEEAILETNPNSFTRSNALLPSGLTKVSSPTGSPDGASSAVDSAGNVHLVWSDNITGDRNIYYSMFGSNGKLLIAPTALAPSPQFDIWPTINVTSSNKVVVVWMNGDDDDIVFWTRINPYLDDRNGDAASYPKIAELGRRIVGHGYHPASFVDSAGNTHLAYEEGTCCGAPFVYAKIDPNGIVMIPPVQIGTVNNKATPTVVADSNGHAHIVWSDDAVTSEDELYYAMVNGKSGAIMIAKTLLTANDSNETKHPTALQNRDGTLSIVYGSQGTSGLSDWKPYFMKIKPSLDNQDGDAADLATITVVAETLVGPDDGNDSWYVNASRTSDGNIMVAWSNQTGCSDGEFQAQKIQESGAKMGNPFIESTGTKVYYNWSCFVDPSVAAGRAFWVQNQDGTLKTRMVTASLDSFRLPMNLASSAGTVTLQQFVDGKELQTGAFAALPTTVTFSGRFVRSVITGLSNGAAVNLTVRLEESVPASAKYYRWDGAAWVVQAHTAGTAAGEVVISLTDGGPGDADGVANGRIVHSAGGLGFAIPKSGGGGGGCSMTAAGGPVDPLLPLLAVIAGLFLMRRRSGAAVH